jgi:hypothetical protein
MSLCKFQAQNAFHLRGCVREQYKSYLEISHNILNYWIEIIL